MTTSLRKQSGTALANIFTKDIQQKRSNYYHFLGKFDVWGEIDTAPTTIQEDSDFENNTIRNDATYFKKILPGEVSLALKRYDWSMGTVYENWDNTKNMQDKNFYVLTEDDCVYKCLDNNQNSQQTIKPTGNNLESFYTADGYLWKYMYSIPKSKKTKFLTNDYIPTQKALSESFYSGGSVEQVNIVSGGSGFSDTNLTTIILSDIVTTGSGAQLTFTLNATGSIATVTVVNGGSGYTKGARIKINSSNGVDAELIPIIVLGVVVDVLISKSGIAYDSSDLMEVYVGGAELIPKLNSETGQLEDIIIYDSGIGYLSAPTLTLFSPTSTGATGKYGNPTAIIKAIVYDGKIQTTTIEDPGLNYLSSNITQIVASGDGIDFYARPVIHNGEIVDVIVENSGFGYTQLTLQIIGDGSGAILTPIFANSDIISDQQIIEQVGVDGAIYCVKITNGGQGYSALTTTVQIIGDGSGATATATILNGEIIKINMTNFGKNYTFANVQIQDSARNNDMGLLEDFSSYVILPPVGGHGVDAPKELLCNTIEISTTLKPSFLSDFYQDYRQYGVLRNPIDLFQTNLSTVDVLFNVYKININTTAGLVLDETLIDDEDQEFKLLAFENSGIVYLLHNKNLSDPIGSLISKNDPARIYSIDSISQRPTINKQSGELLYVTNEMPFEFNETQGLTIKTFIKF